MQELSRSIQAINAQRASSALVGAARNLYFSGISTVAVLKQIRKMDSSRSRLEPQSVQGYGWLCVEKHGESLTGKWVVVALKP
jgi:hypothetical protein